MPNYAAGTSLKASGGRPRDQRAWLRMGFGVVNSRFRPPSTSGPDAPSDVTPPYDDAAAREVYADPFISSTGHEKTGGLEVAMEGFKGILVKGKNSNEYLLGIGPR